MLTGTNQDRNERAANQLCHMLRSSMLYCEEVEDEGDWVSCPQMMGPLPIPVSFKALNQLDNHKRQNQN